MPDRQGAPSTKSAQRRPESAAALLLSRRTRRVPCRNRAFASRLRDLLAQSVSSMSTMSRSKPRRTAAQRARSSRFFENVLAAPASRARSTTETSNTVKFHNIVPQLECEHRQFIALRRGASNASCDRRRCVRPTGAPTPASRWSNRSKPSAEVVVLRHHLRAGPRDVERRSACRRPRGSPGG